MKKKLPKKFQGAVVVRGLGMKSAQLDTLVEKKAMDCFDATRDTYLVVADRALADIDGSETVRCFSDEEVAIRYARAMANGNVDHRVLRIAAQTLVVGTDNDL